jgi:hypothetical protein
MTTRYQHNELVLTYSQSHPLDIHAEVWFSLKYDVLTHLGLSALNVRLQSNKPQYFSSEIPKLADSPDTEHVPQISEHLGWRSSSVCAILGRGLVVMIMGNLAKILAPVAVVTVSGLVWVLVLKVGGRGNARLPTFGLGPVLASRNAR